MAPKQDNRWDEWAAGKNPDEVKKEKTRIMKNILVISTGFLFNFTAFQVRFFFKNLTTQENTTCADNRFHGNFFIKILHYDRCRV